MDKLRFGLWDEMGDKLDLMLLLKETSLKVDLEVIKEVLEVLEEPPEAQM
jgi:hypothetical protein